MSVYRSGLSEITQGSPETFLGQDNRPPAQTLHPRQIKMAASAKQRLSLRTGWQVLDLETRRWREPRDQPGKIENGGLLIQADVVGTAALPSQQQDQERRSGIGHVAERTTPGAVAVEHDIAPGQCVGDEIGEGAAVIQRDPWAIGVGNTRDHGMHADRLPNHFTIGQASRHSGVSAKAIRHYESLGLLGAVARTGSNYRQYSENDVHTLCFIRRSRDMGFGLDAITELVSLWHNRRRSSASVKRIAQKHRDELGQRIEALQAMQRTLDELLCHCPGNDRPDCPILDDLGSL